MFQGLKDWFDRRTAMREIRVGEDESRHFKQFFSEQIELAYEAFRSGALEQAYDIWTKMRMRFPGHSVTSDRCLYLLLDLGRYDEAEALMREGIKRYRRRRASFAAEQPAFLATGLARVAHRRGDLVEALRRCDVLCRKFPRVGEGYIIAAACLEGLGRHEEAEAITEQAVRKFPNEFAVLIGYARQAVRRSEWLDALSRFQVVKDKFNEIQGRTGYIQCLRELGRHDEAEQVAIETCDLFPRDPWAFVELARIADGRGNADEAARRWKTARQRNPGLAVAYIAGAESAVRAGRAADADDILGLAVTRMKSDLGVHLVYARSAHQRGEWVEAAKRWSLVRERFPACEEAHERESEALARITPADLADATHDERI